MALIEVKDGDQLVFELAARHYSARRVRARLRRGPVRGRGLQVAGPGEKLVLRSAAGDAAFVWVRSQFGLYPGDVLCSLFRNEGPRLSSALIDEACLLAWDRWPGLPLWTMVAPRRVRSSNPGFCFQVAGFVRVGVTARGLLIFRKEAGCGVPLVPERAQGVSTS